MKITEQREQEALKVLEMLNEKQWGKLQKVAEILASEPSEEKSESTPKHTENKANEKEESRRASERLKDYGRTLLNGFRVPERYEMTGTVTAEMVQLTAPIKPHAEGLIEAVWIAYQYGFKRGTAYQKNQNKKKAALCATNTKNGSGCPIDEI